MHLAVELDVQNSPNTNNWEKNNYPLKNTKKNRKIKQKKQKNIYKKTKLTLRQKLETETSTKTLNKIK